MTITYEWKDTEVCYTAVAKVGDKVAAKARLIKLGKDPNAALKQDRFYQEVEEAHYSLDREGKVVYKARSRFRIPPYGALKIAEEALVGKKNCEFFSHFSRFKRMPGITF